MFVAAAFVPRAEPLSPAEAAVCGPADGATRLCVAVYRWTGNSVLAEAADDLVLRPAKILLVFAMAFVATRLLRRLIRRFVIGIGHEAVQHRLGRVQPGRATPVRASQRAETIAALLRSISSFAIWTIAIITALGELGINLGPLIAGAGIVGIALGFGAQNLVRDFIAGIFMLIEDQYGVGDVIDAGPASGTVEGVSLRTTRLRDINGVVWHIPNGTIARVGNQSQQWSRALLDIPVSYSTDLDFAKAVIHDTACEVWRDDEFRDRILEEPEVWGVEALGADGINIRLGVKTAPADQWVVARELRGRMKAAFDAAGIEIPFPQRVIWHRGIADAEAADAVRVNG